MYKYTIKNKIQHLEGEEKEKCSKIYEWNVVWFTICMESDDQRKLHEL